MKSNVKKFCNRLDLWQVSVSVFSICVSMLVGIGLIALMGIDPVKALNSLWEGSFSSIKAVAETTVKMTPLLFTGMSYALANRCGLTNLGMEGQLYMGALFASIVGIYVSGLPSILHVLLTILAGMLGGGLWGLIAGTLKVFFRASEIITTVMLNTIAINLVEFMVNGPIIEPPGINNQTRPVLESARLNRIVPDMRAHWGFLVAIMVLILFWFFLFKSKKGFEVRVSGQNTFAATYSGINTRRNILLIMFLAGGVAGLAGCIEIIGVQTRLVPVISPGYGFDGIAVSLIGNNAPWGIFFGALLFGAFRAGGNRMQMRTQTPITIISVIQALVIIAVISGNILTDKIKARKMVYSQSATE